MADPSPLKTILENLPKKRSRNGANTNSRSREYKRQKAETFDTPSTNTLSLLIRDMEIDPNLYHSSRDMEIDTNLFPSIANEINDNNDLDDIEVNQILELPILDNLYSVNGDNIEGLRLIIEEQRNSITREQKTRKLKEMKTKENLLIKNTPIHCTDNLDLYRENLPTLNTRQLANALWNEFYNASLMESTTCIIESIVKKYYNSDKYRWRIKDWFRNLSQIGEPSKFGYAIASELKNNDLNKPFIIKTARDKRNDTLEHEYIVGAFGTNRLRSIIPNFAYVFGIFRCLPTYIHTTARGAEILTWCNNTVKGKNVNYIVYENIVENITWKNYIVDCTIEELVKYYLAILLALKTAYDEIGFTHYDLHFNNVLMRETNNYSVPYSYKDSTVYIIGNKIPTFIDYGFSAIDYEGENYGVELNREYVKSRGYPYSDAYKLLGFTLNILIHYELVDKIEVMTNIMRFFTSIDIQTLVNIDGNQRYNLPYDTRIDNMDLEVLIDYVIDNNPRYLTNDHFVDDENNLDPNIQILNCANLQCRDDNYLNPHVNNIYDLYDLYNYYLDKKLDTNDLVYQYKNNPNDMVNNEAISNIDSMMRDIIKMESKIVNVESISNGEFLDQDAIENSIIFGSEDYANLFKYNLNIVKIYDMYTEIYRKSYILYKCIRFTSMRRNLKALKSIVKTINTYYRILNKKIIRLNTDKELITESYQLNVNGSLGKNKFKILTDRSNMTAIGIIYEMIMELNVYTLGAYELGLDLKKLYVKIR